MRIKKPRQASPDEVKISRESDGAVIEFADRTISTTHFKIGPQVRHMSDQAILDMFILGLASRFVAIRPKRTLEASAEWSHS